MGGTCMGTDNTAPIEVLEALRKHINVHKAGSPPPHFRDRQFVDHEGCCLLEDLGGNPCPGSSCAYSPSNTKTGPDYASHKPLHRPVPGLPIAAAKSARKRRAAPRKRPARRKSKAGRRRR